MLITNWIHGLLILTLLLQWRAYRIKRRKKAPTQAITTILTPRQ